MKESIKQDETNLKQKEKAKEWYRSLSQEEKRRLYDGLRVFVEVSKK